MYPATFPSVVDTTALPAPAMTDGPPRLTFWLPSSPRTAAVDFVVAAIAPVPASTAPPFRKVRLPCPSRESSSDVCFNVFSFFVAVVQPHFEQLLSFEDLHPKRESLSDRTVKDVAHRR
jgi:hypothetical protein